MILDNLQQLQELQQQVVNKEIILIPILEDEFTHLASNRIIGYYIKILHTDKEYTVFIEHPEALYTVDIVPFLSTCKKVYCYNKQALIYNGLLVLPNMVDAFMQMYLYENSIPDIGVSRIADFYRRKFPIKTSLITDAIKLQSRARFIAESISIHNNTCERFYEEAFAKVFHTIERNGMKVDKQAFMQAFPDNTALIGEYAFSKYNFYTATGRPSNRFGGVNFAALNKEDDTREAFMSRYENGILLELDFQSYHPRILADIVQYTIDDGESIYEHLAKHYFNTTTPTADEVSEAKELTFKQLYGGISNKYKGIEYFSKIDNFTQILWDSFQSNGHIQSLISKRILHKQNIEDVNPTKLLNYFIQLHETEQNVIFLSSIFDRLDADIKPILYTYDSILFDVPGDKVDDLKQLIASCIPGRFPYRFKSGTNYKSLQ